MKLTEEQQTWLVTQYAMFRPTWQIIRMFREEFDDTIDKRQAASYDPRREMTKGRRRSAKWDKIFEEARARFLASASEIPICDATWRLRELHEMYVEAREKGNARLAASLLEQASKEHGGAFTNKREVEHSGTVKVDDVSEDEKRNMLKDALHEALSMMPAPATAAQPATKH